MDPRQTTAWQNEVKPRVKRRDQYRCQGCGMNGGVWPGVDLQVHHILPVEKGGGNDDQNLVTLCNRCHWRLHRKEDENEELPVSLLDKEDIHVPSATRRENANMGELKEEIITLLKTNGPMQLKDIIEETGWSRGWVQRQLDLLKVAGFAARVSRGVYSYISEDQYWEAQQNMEEQFEKNEDDLVMIESYEPTHRITYWCYQSRTGRLEDTQNSRTGS